MQVTRRDLAKGLAAGSIALAGLPQIGCSEKSENSEPQSAAWHEVFPGVWRATIGKPEAVTPVSSRLIQPLTDGFGRLPLVAQAPLPEIRGSVTSRGCAVTLPLRAHESVYGLGLQMLSLDQRGKKKIVRVNADPKVDTGDSHAPVPFYVTTEGIGVLIDTARYANFYFGDARPRPAHAMSSVQAKVVDPDYTSGLQADQAGEIHVEVPRAGGVDVYLFGGPSMLDAVRRYNVFSGGGPLPPEWALGFWYRADARSTQQEALDLAQTFRDQKIPCDVLGLEPGWQTHAYSCTFVWDKSRFPDPNSFVAQAGAKHYRINLWEHAYTHPASPLFEPLQANSGDYGVWGGLVPDFAGEAARNAFGDYHGKTFVDAGVSGFKLDECDNSDFTGGWGFPELSRFPSGVDGEQMHSLFGLRYQAAIWDQFRKRSQPTYNLVRSSGALAAPYPFVLYSDLYDHRVFIRALVNAGFSGLLWCPEVRDAVSVEDLIRRLQSVMFSPLAMVNGWYIKSPPWQQLNREMNNAGHLMDNWQQVQARCREIIGWRMQLVPYLTAAFERYVADGTPPFRALVLEWPDQDPLRGVDDQYLVGDRMLVAPLFAGEPERKVVLPAGSDWHDFWTGTHLPGGSSITVPSSTEKIPVYVKAGSVIPWAKVGLYAGTPEARSLSVRVYGDGSLPFELGSGANRLRLSWSNGRGSTEGGSGYTIETWQAMGK